MRDETSDLGKTSTQLYSQELGLHCSGLLQDLIFVLTQILSKHPGLLIISIIRVDLC